jgi:hypothetical protein
MMEHASRHEPVDEQADIYARLERLREGAISRDPDIARLCWQEIDILLDKLNSLDRVTVKSLDRRQ